MIVIVAVVALGIGLCVGRFIEMDRSLPAEPRVPDTKPSPDMGDIPLVRSESQPATQPTPAANLDLIGEAGDSFVPSAPVIHGEP